VRIILAIAALSACAACASAADLTLYESDNFNGRAFSVRDAVGNLSDHGFNDRASSVIIRSGTWQICDDAYYGGQCIVLGPGRYSSLRQMGMNDRISSARTVRGGGGGYPGGGGGGYPGGGGGGYPGGGGGGHPGGPGYTPPANDNQQNNRGAPTEVTVACAQAGDKMWNFPPGTTLPYEARPIGGDLWDVRITGNTKVGVCRVTSNGSVQNVYDQSQK
jgi:hypothetical protein